MSLIERIQEGRDLIALGKSLGKNTTEIESEVKNLQFLLQTEVCHLKLSEFENRHMALLVESQVLGDCIWFCSDEEMATQIKADQPEAITYTVDELREVINLNPSPEEMNTIKDAKIVFLNSKIIETQLNNKLRGENEYPT